MIPTRERCETLPFAIRSALGQETRDLQVLVSDNQSTDATPEIVRGFADPRLTYVRAPRRMPMSEHWDFALEHADGKYVTFIGDDDAVMPGGIDRLLELMSRLPSDVYTWPRDGYVWPMNGRPGRLEYIASLGAPFTFELPTLARKIARRGGWNWGRLPCLYHSLVRRQITEEMKRKAGRVFDSLAPDIFTAFTLPALAERAVNVGRGITVSGYSPKSFGGAVRGGRTRVRILDQFIAEYGGFQLHPRLFPGIPELMNELPDALLKAMDAYPELYRGINVDFNLMWIAILRMAKGFGLSLALNEVIRRRREIARYHSLSPIRLALYSTFPFQRLSGLWSFAKYQRHLRTNPLKDLAKAAPANIYDLVREIDARLCRIGAESGSPA